MSGLLSRSRSLKSRRDIQQLFRQGFWLKGEYFTVVFRQSPDTAFLFTVPKHTPTAVERNRKKRMARESLRIAGTSSLIPEGHYALILRKIPVGSALQILSDELIKLFSEATSKLPPPVGQVRQ